MVLLVFELGWEGIGGYRSVKAKKVFKLPEKETVPKDEKRFEEERAEHLSHIEMC